MLADAGASTSACSERDAVVDVEERDLEVGLDAVRLQQPLDRTDQRVLPLGEPGMPGDAVEVAERGRVLGSGIRSTAGARG